MLLDYAVPTVMFVGAVERTGSVFADDVWIVEQSLKLGAQVAIFVTASISKAGSGDDFQVRWSVVDQNAVTESHGFDERGMSSAHFIRENEEVGVLLQLGVAFALNSTGKNKQSIAAGFQN